MKLYGRQKERKSPPIGGTGDAGTGEVSLAQIIQWIDANRRLKKTLQETQLDNTALRLVALGKSPALHAAAIW